MDLKTPIKDAGRSYSMYAKRLEKLGIYTLEDLIYHVPSRFEDYSLIAPISSLQPGEIVTIQGSVESMKNVYTKRFKNLQKAVINDGTKTIEATWFNQPFLVRNIKAGDRISVSGKIELFGPNLTILPYEYEIVKNDKTIHTGRLVPIYPQTYGVSSKWLRNRISQLIFDLSTLEEFLPQSLRNENNLLGLSDALKMVHFPKDDDEAQKAKKRLAFDEFFIIQLSGLKRKELWEKQQIGTPFDISKHRKKIQEFWEKLPFKLTNAQNKAVKEIFADLASNKKPMNRLLEGDVGSGKTVVSAIAMYLAFLNKYQSVLMAPTEILATQHYKTISDLLLPFGVRIGLVTGSSKYYVSSSMNKTKNKHNTKYIIQNTDIIIGTHAVLSKHITFETLGLVIIDEQQRFGVEQRAAVRNKGKNPHLLTMTATPIPRTVALTMYGDLDLSLLDEVPKGRRKVKTWLVPKNKREPAYLWIRKQIKKNSAQVFIICPFIEESESLTTVKAAKKVFEHLQKRVFPDLKLDLMHGRLKTKEKKDVLESFRDGKIDILVATPIVEVGIDIKNATIILIEGAERFGLSQLHQLRGRVGRSNKQSFCLLFTENENDLTLTRLKSLETLHVGAQLAELDLKLRGPGELYGTEQHGMPLLKVASFTNARLIDQTRKAAIKTFPNLIDFPLLQMKLRKHTIKEVTPD